MVRGLPDSAALLHDTSRPHCTSLLFYNHKKNILGVSIDAYSVSKLEAEQGLYEIGAKRRMEIVCIPPSFMGLE